MTTEHTAARPAGAEHIATPWFIAYKGVNSLFLGLSIGTVFVLYAPLSPSVFSAGGIGLAVASLLVATQYHRLFTLPWFFRISLAVELVMLAAIVGVLLFPIEMALALAVYVGYQIVFTFGGYLVRYETLLFTTQQSLSRLDIAKQVGYLSGMGLSWLIYTVMERSAGIVDKAEQVVAMHWPLLVCELLVIALLCRALWPALNATAATEPRKADGVNPE